MEGSEGKKVCNLEPARGSPKAPCGGKGLREGRGRRVRGADTDGVVAGVRERDEVQGPLGLQGQHLGRNV